MSQSHEDLSLLEELVRRACRGGASAADAVLIRSAGLSHRQRLGKTENLEREEAFDLGLRVLDGKRQAIVSSTDLAKGALDALLDRALAMVKSVPEDPYCGLADPDQLAREIPDLDLFDPQEVDPDTLKDLATACEDAALAVAGVTNSDGAEASWGRHGIALAASNGFARSYDTSSHAVSASVLAGEGLGMETDYDFSTAIHGEDLEDAALVGRRAGERAVRRLKARKPRTAKLPIVFEPRVAGSILGHLAGAISGPAVARGTSFLKDSLGKELFDGTVSIIDDPHRLRGLRSKPFDAEGLANSRRAIIDKGVLTTWILSLASARQLGLESTGHASRSPSSPPGPATSNLYIEPGAQSPQELIADIAEGFMVTDMMGMGVNPVTGDYSRGAAGFWIEKGEITYPVSEATIAGNLKDMFRNLTPANDLVFRYGTNAPTLRIEGMTVAGA